MKSFYITAAIPYVNGSPHLGHALEFLQLDVVARYMRQKLGENNVIALTGADENSLKNVQAAEKEKITTQELCDRNSRKFENLINSLNIKIDIFQRSSSKNHTISSQKLWKLCEANGDIYKKTYTGLYCVGCEQFYTKEELTSGGLCLEHLTKPQEISEENYFFRLSKYENQIKDLIESNKLKITPEIRKNEVLGFIKQGLEDFSISRSAKRAKNWGVPVPDDSTQIMYVWFDALNVYQSGVGFGIDEDKYAKWWPPFAHIIGKGIIRFHAVYWIGILLSAKLSLPQNIFVHGYISINGQKMSKSLGNVIAPKDLLDKYGIDPVRYYLLREIPTTSDGDFSEKRFKEVYNSDLAGGLGNTISRIAKLAEKSELSFSVDDSESSSLDFNNEIMHFHISDFINKLWRENLDKINLHISNEAPWTINDPDKLQKVLQEDIDSIRLLAKKIKPIMPDTSKKILSQFKGPKIKFSEPLFPRIG